MPIKPSVGFNTYYKCITKDFQSMDSLRVIPNEESIYKVRLFRNYTLDFYSNLIKSDTLFITFHGANSARKLSYPRFERVASLKNQGASLIAFADPTLQLDRTLDLAWYLGALRL